MRIYFTIFFVALAVLGASVSLADYEFEIPLPTISGEQPTAGLAQYVRYIFVFALGLGGILAFASLVVAGIRLILAGGNIGTVRDAQNQMTQAVAGLMLLLLSFLILRTINPELVRLKNPQLTLIEIPPPPPPPPPPPFVTLRPPRLPETPMTPQERQAILKQIFSHPKSCFASQTKRDELAQARPATLRGLLVILEGDIIPGSDKERVCISSVSTGGHVTGSCHYSGLALDLTFPDGLLIGLQRWLYDNAQRLEIGELFGPDTSIYLNSRGQLWRNPGSLVVNGHQRHIHVSFNRCG